MGQKRGRRNGRGVTLKAIVTVRIHRNIKHDPLNKLLDVCPLNFENLCTDATGEHHSYVEEGNSFTDIKNKAARKFGHVTRIEEVKK